MKTTRNSVWRCQNFKHSTQTGVWGLKLQNNMQFHCLVTIFKHFMCRPNRDHVLYDRYCSASNTYFWFNCLVRLHLTCTIAGEDHVLCDRYCQQSSEVSSSHYINCCRRPLFQWNKYVTTAIEALHPICKMTTWPSSSVPYQSVFQRSLFQCLTI